MLRWIIETSLKWKYCIIGIAIILVICGGIAIQKTLPLNILPVLGSAHVNIHHQKFKQPSAFVMLVGVSSNKLSALQLSELSQWMIVPRLMGIPGVSHVAILGQRARQMQVLIDPKRIQENNVTQDQLVNTITHALWYPSFSHGWIETPNQQLNIRSQFSITSVEDLALLPIAGSKGKVGDVAVVVEGQTPLIEDVFLGNEFSVMLAIEKLPLVNTLKVTEEIEKVLQGLEVALPGVMLDAHTFPITAFLTDMMHYFIWSFSISILLIVAGLFLFLFNWRLVVSSVMVIPVALLTTAFLLSLFHFSMNIMVFTGVGLALAAVMGSTIIGMSHMMMRLREVHRQGKQYSLSSVIQQALIEVKKPIFYSTLTMIFVMAPLFCMQGLTGDLVKPLAYTYSVILLISMICAFTLMPAITILFFRKNKIGDRESFIAIWIKKHYENILRRIIEKTRLIAPIVGGMIAIAFIIFVFLGESYLPDFKERNLVVEIDGIPGISQQETARMIKRMSSAIKELPGIDKVAALSTDKIQNHRGQVWVMIDKKANHENTMNEIKKLVYSFEGLKIDVYTYSRNHIKRMMTKHNEDLIIRIEGPKEEILTDLAEKIKQILSHISGIKEIQIQGQISRPQIAVKVDITKASVLGMNPGDIERAETLFFKGIKVGHILKNEKAFDVIIWSVPEARDSLSDLQNMPLDKPGGGYIHLSDVASINIIPESFDLKPSPVLPSINIVANIQGRDISRVFSEVEKNLKMISLPSEYHQQLLGEYIEWQITKQNILLFGMVIVILIYVLLFMFFSNGWIASMAWLTLPVAIMGGIFANLLSGAILSLGSLIGFLAVLGFAIHYGMDLMFYLKTLNDEKGAKDAIIHASCEKVLPILTTASISMLALFPFICFGNAPGLSVLHPLAVVVFGGLVATILLVLFVIPALYLSFLDKRE